MSRLIIIVSIILASCSVNHGVLDPNNGVVDHNENGVMVVKFFTVDGKDFAYDYFVASDSTIKKGTKAKIVFE